MFSTTGLTFTSNEIWYLAPATFDAGRSKQGVGATPIHPLERRELLACDAEERFPGPVARP